MIDIQSLGKSIRRKKVLIDSNIIIYLTEEVEPYDQLSRELFSMVEQGFSTASPGDAPLFRNRKALKGKPCKNKGRKQTALEYIEDATHQKLSRGYCFPMK